MAELPPEEAALVTIQDAPFEAAPQDWHGLYWTAWASLQFERQYPSGHPTPVSYIAISQYARDHGISGAAFELFYTLFSALDDEWRRMMDEQAPRETP